MATEELIGAYYHGITSRSQNPSDNHLCSAEKKRQDKTRQDNTSLFVNDEDSAKPKTRKEHGESKLYYAMSIFPVLAISEESGDVVLCHKQQLQP